MCFACREPVNGLVQCWYHVVLLAGRVISTKPTHGVLSIPLHHLPALWAGISVQVTEPGQSAHTLDNDTALLDRTGLPRVDHLLGSFSVFKEKLPGLLLIFNTRQPEERQTGQRQSEERHTGDRVTATRTDKEGGADLMGMSFISSLNMDGEMTGSQSLGSKGS